jgi:hypothetical protein
MDKVKAESANLLLHFCSEVRYVLVVLRIFYKYGIDTVVELEDREPNVSINKKW